MARDDALGWARAARATRHQVREELSTGASTLSEVLDRADSDELTAAVRLGWALESLPGARKVDTRRALDALAIDGDAPLGALDDGTRRTVLERFAAGPAGAPAAGPVSDVPEVPDEGVAAHVPRLPPDSNVVVVSGPGGVGKGTLVEELLRREPRLWLSRSWTTRARRDGESPDAYHFASEAEFLERAAAGGFLEWTRFLDYRQGSPVPDPPGGSDVLFEIDVQGAANIRRLYPEALLIFVDAPDRATQEARLRGRGDDEERVRQRLAKAEEEVARAAEMDFVHVVNDDLDRTVEELAGLIAGHRSR
jgi:guanylate kinase